MKKMAIGVFASCVVATSCIIAALPAQADDPGIPKGITWYGVLKDGLAEAKRTGKPILLTSAAPQCAGVSGMW